MTMASRAADALRTWLGLRADLVVRAPGRVNIIGEHTDYNGGLVMPIATDLATYTAAAVREDRTVRAYSAAMGEVVEFRLDGLAPRGGGHWSDYLRGMAWSLQKEGVELRGVDAAIVSDVPTGSGVSSSAALEVSWGLALLAAVNEEMDRQRLALVCQRAENDFVGMKCGIMDQLASLLGREGHAVLLDCATLDHRLVPLSAERLSVVVMDTGKPRALVDSEYNLRREQCQAAAGALGLSVIGGATMDQLEAVRGRLDDVTYRRARHVIAENGRVQAVAAALTTDDFTRVGQLLNESHASLAEDYEVSCRELDLISEIARGEEGCYGARLVGAGFGGCAMALVAAEATDDFCRAVKLAYDAVADYTSAIFAVKAAAGAGLAGTG